VFIRIDLSWCCIARAMTSVAPVEIIDLTESTPEKEKETVFISPDDGTDAEAEKGPATPARRKRKNGEIGKARNTPARSRGNSLEPGHASSGEGIDVQPTEDGRGNNGESMRKKKRRSKKGKGKDMDTSPPSREDTQQDALSSLDDGQLFFVDTAPAPVLPGMAFALEKSTHAGAQSSSQVPSSSTDKVSLLLPAHVSVLDPGDDFPVQVVQRADSDSDSESYIEYLDYDDRLVRTP
jgi:protein AIR1/2